MQHILLISMICFSGLLSAKTLKLTDPLPANLFVELAKKINPAVVNISTKTLPNAGSRNYQNDPMFELFEQFMGRGMVPRVPRSFQALGTGFLIRKDGLILTNSHVVEKADTINVTLMDKPDVVYEAEVIGHDSRTDVALIKISGKKDFPFVSLGTSKNLQVGEWVAAFGNPFGHANTMTKGIISAIGRQIDELNKFPFLQTDASINQGNSGGPLVNVNGEVIGVNTAIDARAQGIGFAIPIDNVKSILDELEKTGQVERGYIGVHMRNLTPQLAKSLDLDSSDGVLVIDVQEGHAAKRAGLRPYDVITKFGSKVIENSNDLVTAVSDTKVGKSTQISIFREGHEKQLSLKVGRRESKKAQRRIKKSQALSAKKAPYNLGFDVVELNAQMATIQGVQKEYIGHPVVTQVQPSSPAREAGLRAGDVIIDINRQKVKSSSRPLKKLKKSSNILKVLRDDRVLLIIIES